MTETISNKFNVFTGKLVRLRAYRLDDVDEIWRQQRDNEIARLDSNIRWPVSSEEIREWIESKLQKEKGDDRTLIIETLDGRNVGGVNTQLSDTRNGVFSIGIGIAEREAWGKGYAKEAMLLMLRHMFHERRYQKCNIGVYDFNERALGFYRHFGFVEEGRIRRAYFSDNRYHDEILMGMTAEEFNSRYA